MPWLDSSNNSLPASASAHAPILSIPIQEPLKPKSDPILPLAKNLCLLISHIYKVLPALVPNYLSGLYNDHSFLQPHRPPRSTNGSGMFRSQDL